MREVVFFCFVILLEIYCEKRELILNNGFLILYACYGCGLYVYI